MKARPWTPEEDEVIVREYRTRTVAEIGRSLGRWPNVACKRFHVLAKQGRVDPSLRFFGAPILRGEVRGALGKIRAGWTAEDAAACYGRTANTLYTAFWRRGIQVGTRHRLPGTLTLMDVCRLLGMSTGQNILVRDWILSGLLEGKRRKPGAHKGSPWIISPAALIAFLGQCPAEYEYDRIPDRLDGKPNPWKTYARRQDPTRGYLTLKQAARALGISYWQVRVLIHSGGLPAVHLHAREVGPKWWFIPREAVESLRRAA